MEKEERGPCVKTLPPEVLKALQFYADPETYFGIAFLADPPCGDFTEDVSETEDLGMKPGKRARELLDKLYGEGLVSFSGLANTTAILEEECGIEIDDVMHKLTQEVGELNDAIQKTRGRYCRSSVTPEGLRKEFGDVLLNLLSLCSKMGIDPDDLPVIAKETLKSFADRVPDYVKYRKEVEDEGFCSDNIME